MFRWLRKSQEVREPTTRPHDAARIEADFDSKRRALGVDDGLKDVPAVTTRMVVWSGRNGIKRIDALAGYATYDIVGWTEFKTPAPGRYAGILDDFEVSRKDCEAMIMYARVKAGWIDGPLNLTQP